MFLVPRDVAVSEIGFDSPSRPDRDTCIKDEKQMVDIFSYTTMHHCEAQGKGRQG